MDSAIAGLFVIGIVVLPFIGSKWSFIASLVIASLLAGYGIVGLISTAASLPMTNSDLSFTIASVIIVAGCFVGLVAWVMRRRALKKSASRWS